MANLLSIKSSQVGKPATLSKLRIPARKYCWLQTVAYCSHKKKRRFSLFTGYTNVIPYNLKSRIARELATITLGPELTDCFTFFDNSKKNSLARSDILLSLSSKQVAISLIWPLTLTMSFRIRCVSTISVFLRTWLDSSRNLRNKRNKATLVPSYKCLARLQARCSTSWLQRQVSDACGPNHKKLKRKQCHVWTNDSFFSNCQEIVLVAPSRYNGKQTWHRDETSMARSSWEIWRSGHQLLQSYSLWWSVEEPEKYKMEKFILNDLKLIGRWLQSRKKGSCNL